MKLTARKKIKQYTISAKVTRADGTVEDLGIIAEVKPISPIKKLWRKIING